MMKRVHTGPESGKRPGWIVWELLGCASVGTTQEKTEHRLPQWSCSAPMMFCGTRPSFICPLAVPLACRPNIDTDGDTWHQEHERRTPSFCDHHYSKTNRRRVCCCPLSLSKGRQAWNGNPSTLVDWPYGVACQGGYIAM